MYFAISVGRRLVGVFLLGGGDGDDPECLSRSSFPFLAHGVFKKGLEATVLNIPPGGYE